jgi:hypothetical protein
MLSFVLVQKMQTDAGGFVGYETSVDLKNWHTKPI